MAPSRRYVDRFAVLKERSLCVDSDVRWLFLVILCICLVFTMHASARTMSWAGALGGTHTHAMTIATPALSSPVAGALIDAAAAARSREQATTPRRAVRSVASKRLRAYNEDQVQRLIRRYADTLGLDPDLPLAIARCESQFQWDAANPGSTARGVFQFVRGTWARTLEGRRGTSALDAEANIRMAVRHIATIGTSPWNASRACWGASRPDAVATVASTTPVEETSDASTTDN
jgi:hypothetical protein